MLSSKSCLKVVEEGIGQGYMYGNIGPTELCALRACFQQYTNL